MDASFVKRQLLAQIGHILHTLPYTAVNKTITQSNPSHPAIPEYATQIKQIPKTEPFHTLLSFITNT